MPIAHRTRSRLLGVRFLFGVVVLIVGGWAIGLTCIGTGASPRDQAVQRLQTALLEGDDSTFDAACSEQPCVLAQRDLENALRMAAIYRNEPCLCRLLAAGVDPNAADDCGNTPLMLLAAGPDGLATVRQLVDGGADVNASDNRGRTALMKAIAARQIRMVGFLLDHGARVQPIDEGGESALSEAFRTGDVAVIGLIEQAIEKSRRRAKSDPGRRIG